MSVKIGDGAGDNSSQRFPTQPYRKRRSCSSSLPLPALPGVIYLHLLHYKILAPRSPCLSLSIWREELCFPIIVLQLDVFLTPSGSGEVEMPLLSMACLACPCAQPFAALLGILNELSGALRARQLPQLQLGADWCVMHFSRADQLKEQERTVTDRPKRKGRSGQWAPLDGPRGALWLICSLLSSSAARAGGTNPAGG